MHQFLGVYTCKEHISTFSFATEFCQILAEDFLHPFLTGFCVRRSDRNRAAKTSMYIRPWYWFSLKRLNSRSHLRTSQNMLTIRSGRQRKQPTHRNPEPRGHHRQRHSSKLATWVVCHIPSRSGVKTDRCLSWHKVLPYQQIHRFDQDRIFLTQSLKRSVVISILKTAQGLKCTTCCATSHAGKDCPQVSPWTTSCP